MKKNILLNLAGSGIPLIVALWAMPFLLHSYGNEKFGVLSIVWALIGYFSIFDLGMGRALTKLVAERLAANKKNEIDDLVGTALVALMVMGLCAIIFVIFLAPWVAKSILKLNGDLMLDGVYSIKILSIGLPFVMASSAMVGLLEAHEKFSTTNTLKTVTGVLNFIGPSIVTIWSVDLICATLILVAIRIAVTIAYAYFCVKNSIINSIIPKKFEIKKILTYGGWITVSNIISPLMVQMDRFVVSAVLGVAVLSYYVIPVDLINRLIFIPAALTGVLFPKFSGLWCNNKNAGILLYNKSIKMMALVIIPFCAMAYFLAPIAIGYMVDDREFIKNSEPIIKILIAGYFFNSMAQIPYITLQSAGYPSVTAKIHLLEAPIYMLGTIILLNYCGIVGAAIGWSLRMCVDSVVLFYFVSKKVTN